MSNVKYDFPAGFFQAGTLLDASLSFTEQDVNVPGGRIFIEKYAALKSEYRRLPNGTRSANHPNSLLFTEKNFTDIGGGVITFERHYAVIPPQRISFETIVVNVLTVNLLGIGVRRYLNATSVDEVSVPSDPLRVGRISTDIKCRVTTRYGLEGDLSDIAVSKLPISIIGVTIPEGSLVAQDAVEPWFDPIFVLKTYRVAEDTQIVQSF